MAFGMIDFTETDEIVTWQGYTPRVEIAKGTFTLTTLASGGVDVVTTNKLIDLGASFESDGIEAGMTVKNTTDGKESIVSSVDSETQLTLATDIFDDVMDQYIIQSTTGTHSWDDFVESSDLRATRVQWNSDSQPNLAKIYIDSARAENWSSYITPLDRVRIKLRSEETVYDSTGIRVTKNVDRIIFVGWPASVTVGGGDSDESVTLLCLGWRYFMDRIPVYGQWVYGKDYEDNNLEFISHLRCTFNEGGRMNRAWGDGSATMPHWSGPYKNGRSTEQDSYLFAWPAPRDETEPWEGHDFWSAGDAIEYVVNRFEDANAQVTLSLSVKNEDLIALREIRLPEVDVDTKSQTEALTAIFNSIGYHWCVLPDLDTGEPRLKWWQCRVGTRNLSVYFPPAGAAVGAPGGHRFANRFDVNYDYKNIVNRYTGLGALQAFENDWDLKKGWDAANESSDPNDEYRYYRTGAGGSANDEWEYYKYVYRRWVIDGSGLITDTPYDFKKNAETGDETGQLGDEYSIRPRHLHGDALTSEEAAGNNKGIRLPTQFFLKDGTEYQRVDTNIDAFDEDDREDGVYIDAGQVKVNDGDKASLWTIMQGKSQGRVIGTLRGDRAVYAARQNNVSVGEHLIRAAVVRNTSFRYEQRWENEYGSTENLRDDTEKLQGYLDEKLAATKDEVISASLSLPYISFDIEPGTLIQRIAGRNVFFGSLTRTGEGYRVIGGSDVVAIDFMLDPEQQMNISLADSRLRPAT